MKNKEESPLSGSDFASPGKAGQEDIIGTYARLAADQMLSLITDAMPDVAMILNKQRQVVFSNKALLSLIGGLNPLDLLGKRPGELLNCIHSAETVGGCGTTQSCRYCGAVNALLECQRTGLQSQKECRISSLVDDQSVSYELQVIATPFRFDNQEFTILAVKDISDQKRRRMLERMFFHDVLNTASGLNGMLVALKEVSNPQEMQEYLEMAGKASNDLIEDIVSQRTLSAAENGDLQLKIVRCSSLQILHDVAAYLSHHEIAENKRIHVDTFSHSVQMETDPQLLKRVLINLVKNALEASPEGSVITIGSKVSDKTIWFWVNNQGQMTEEVQRQIFQRSFSTKGTDRGVGTYSVKLLTNRYLKGSVGLESDESTGTTFRIELPLGLS